MEGSVFPAPAEAFVPTKETAGAHLVSAVATASPGDTVAMTLACLAEGGQVLADPVWVLDLAGRLAGVVPLAELVAAERGALLRTVMRPPPPSVHPGLDQERMAALAQAERLSVVPVADEHGRFLGAVPPLAIIDVLQRARDEDLHRMFGITEVAGRLTAAGALPMWRLALNRLPWLLVGLAGGMLAALVVRRFETELQAYLAIVCFMPAILCLADAICGQTGVVTVRALSSNDASADDGSPARLLWGEFATGTLLGAVLGALALPLCVFVAGDGVLGFAVAVAMVAAGGAAGALGFALPWLLGRFHGDPAYGGGPVATIICDVLSLVIYFVTAGILLGE